MSDVLKRANKNNIASNYSKAIDNKTLLPDFIIKGIDWVNAKTGLNIPTGASNCTLTATLWINPDLPISRALTILDNGDYYGYYKIPENLKKPGDLIIATNPENNSHHSMILSGFIKNPQQHKFMNKSYKLPIGHPIVRYSNGSTNLSGFRTVGLQEYIDNSHGKTQIDYFRYIPPINLPEVIVTPNK